jgi:hypothetical protein
MSTEQEPSTNLTVVECEDPTATRSTVTRLRQFAVCDHPLRRQIRHRVPALLCSPTA